MIIFSQKDARWGSIKVGFGDKTISQVGCTITSLGMVAEITPDEVNRLLRSVNGFQVNLVIWNKINECFKGIKFEWRGYTYEDGRVKEAIDKYGSCLVEVQNGSIKHWVVAIGDGKIADPIDGKVKPFNTYEPTGYAVIQVLERTIEVIKSEFEGMRTKCDKWDKTCESLELNPNEAGHEQIINTIGGYKSKATIAENNLAKYQAQMTNLPEQVRKLKELIANSDLEIKRLTQLSKDNWDKYDAEGKAKGKIIEEMQGYKNDVERLRKELFEGIITIKIKDLLDLILSQKIVLKRK